MKIDAENFERLAAKGNIIKGTWRNDRQQVCLMGALAGVSEKDCTANGWPLWLVQTGVWINDTAKADDLISDGRAFYRAVQAAEKRGADFDRIFRDLRLQSILPIALDAVGDGDGPWRVRCRSAVQWSIDHDGKANPDAVGAAGAARAARAAEAAWAAWAARAAARDRIFNNLIDLLKGETQ